jgi:hypothetical protein
MNEGRRPIGADEFDAAVEEKTVASAPEEFVVYPLRGWDDRAQVMTKTLTNALTKGGDLGRRADTEAEGLRELACEVQSRRNPHALRNTSVDSTGSSSTPHGAFAKTPHHTERETGPCSPSGPPLTCKFRVRTDRVRETLNKCVKNGRLRNSLLCRKESLLLRSKFPVPLSREFWS